MKYLTILLDSEQVESIISRKHKAFVAKSIAMSANRKSKGGLSRGGEWVVRLCPS